MFLVRGREASMVACVFEPWPCLYVRRSLFAEVSHDITHIELKQTTIPQTL